MQAALLTRTWSSTLRTDHGSEQSQSVTSRKWQECSTYCAVRKDTYSMYYCYFSVRQLCKHLLSFTMHRISHTFIAGSSHIPMEQIKVDVHIKKQSQTFVQIQINFNIFDSFVRKGELQYNASEVSTCNDKRTPVCYNMVCNNS